MTTLPIDIRATFDDEITSRAQNALDTFVEFGASADQLGKAFDMLNAAGRSGAKGQAQLANTMRTLVDESEDADAALRNVARAYDLAAAAGLKLEDAGRQVGQALKGETGALRSLGGQYARIAGEIDKVTDLKQRQRMIDQQLTAGLSGQRGVVDRLTNRLAPLNTELAGIGLPTIGATTAIGGLAAGVGALAVGIAAASRAIVSFVSDAIAKYEASVVGATQRTKELEAAQNALEINFGEMASKYGLLAPATESATNAQTGLAGAIGKTTQMMDDLSDPVSRNDMALKSLTGQLTDQEKVLYRYLAPITDLNNKLVDMMTIGESWGLTERMKTAAMNGSTQAATDAHEATMIFGDANEDAATAASRLGARLEMLRQEMVDPVDEVMALAAEIGNLADAMDRVERANFRKKLMSQPQTEHAKRVGKIIKDLSTLEAQLPGLKSKPKTRRSGRGGARARVDTDAKRAAKAAALLDAAGVATATGAAQFGGGPNRILLDLAAAAEKADAALRATARGGAREVTDALKKTESGVKAFEEAIPEIKAIVAMGGAERLADIERDLSPEQTVTALRAMRLEGETFNNTMKDLANGGLAMVNDSLSMMIENATAGRGAFAGLGKALLSSMGDMLTQAGKGLILAALGVKSIVAGIPNPAAAVAIGAGMVAVGSALKGFSSRIDRGQGGSGAGSDGGAGAALDRFGRRLFEREDRTGREVVIQIEDRTMRAYMHDVAADGIRRGEIPLTPRR